MTSQLNRGYMAKFNTGVQAILSGQNSLTEKAATIKKKYEELKEAINDYNAHNKPHKHISRQVIEIIIEIFDQLILKNNPLRDLFIEEFLTKVIQNSIFHLENLIQMIK